MEQPCNCSSGTALSVVFSRLEYNSDLRVQEESYGRLSTEPVDANQRSIGWITPWRIYAWETPGTTQQLGTEPVMHVRVAI